jgi:peptidase M28-like protein
MRRRLVLLVGLSLGTACASRRSASSDPPPTPAVTAADVRAVEFALADDSMEGRNTGRPGSMKAARYIAAEFQRAGLEPAGDSGYFQRVPMKDGGRTPTGRLRAVAAPSFEALDTVPAERRLYGGNVVGVLPGSDPALRDEIVLVDAHYDHLGVGAPEGEKRDSIYNGADDDASGTTAVIMIARALAAGPRPKRTVVFMATTGEETGLIGTRWYIAHPVRPLEKTVANLEIEMIGRPDSLAGGAGRGWLTGFERSTMGDMLRERGIPLVADPRPAQDFFRRSDNIAFAYLGIPAHTLSSYNMHADYHHATDEADRLDYEHMARVIASGASAVRLLSDGPKPAWKPNGRPTPAERPRAVP